MKTGLGVQLRPVKMLAPRSYERWASDLELCWQGETYVDGTDEVFVAHKHIGYAEAKDNGTDPSPDEAFYGLFGGQFDELRTTKGDSTNVGKYVVGDDQRCREEQPNHSFEDAVHDEMRLDNDEI